MVMSSAHLKPRRAPSLMMVRLTGPTGMASNNALKKPVSAERTMGCIASIELRQFFFLFLLFDLMAHPPRNARANEAIDQIKRKKCGQQVIKNLFAEHENQAQEQGRAKRFGKCAGGAQPQGFEGRIFHRADHHRREE